MAPRAIWKGTLKIAELACPVALYTAASTSERISFHTLNRRTGHRVQRQYVDDETGRPVDAAEQVKGYDDGKGGYIVLEPEELAAAIPESDKTLNVETFIRCGDVDDTYFDKPYFIAPATPVAHEAFALIRDGLEQQSAAALARALLFRRVRTVMIRAHNGGLIGTTLNFDYEVRSSESAFEEILARRIEGEMLDLARHIIATKTGRFDPSSFDDRYESALAELVRAKLEGRKLKPLPKPKETPVNDLMAALRESAAALGGPSGAKPDSAKSNGVKSNGAKSESIKSDSTRPAARPRKGEPRRKAG